MAYVLAHLDDRPGLAVDLYVIEDFVVDYMDKNSMAEANQGNGVYNAFKHALNAATMICRLGGTMGEALLNYHETCFGNNMNLSLADRTMNLFNNTVGISLATSQNCGNFAHLIENIRWEFSHGGLKDINGNRIYLTAPVVP